MSKSTVSFAAVLLTAVCTTALAAPKPNVLWILTDDHRYDSIRAFNKMINDQEMSKLGYVESPNTDRLAEMGTTFVNSYCHAQGCAPSRTSMHYGRYPFRSGVYEFEWYNNNAEHSQLSLPEQMTALGYQTFHVGKLGVRVRTTDPKGKFGTHQIYQQDVNFHQMLDEGFTGWSKGEVKEIDGVKLDQPVHCDWFRTPEGKWEYTGEGLNKIAALKNHSKEIDEKYDVLRMYSPSDKKYGKGEIIGGVSSQPAGKTRDGCYTTELVRFLENPNQKLTVGSQTYAGVNPDKPLFVNIGYDFPHTPVMPPASFRKRFQNKKYTFSKFDQAELDKLPPQLKKLVAGHEFGHYTDAEKQQMVQDYYAFCAYGDSLVGQSVDAFLAYCKTQDRPWMIVYTCGDHGWKLSEHDSIYKFSPWEKDSHDPIIVVSSDKQAFPAGKVVTDFTEFVDIAPTIMAAGGADLTAGKFDYLDGYDLAKVSSGELEPRDYIIGESHAVTGPRATIRTKDFMFSLKSRPKNKMGGKDMTWAMNAGYKELEPVLYDLKNDPNELNNLAFNKEFEPVAMKMKEKLLNIVLGDNRVEVNWGRSGSGTDIFRSNFAPGADDKKLKL